MDGHMDWMCVKRNGKSSTANGSISYKSAHKLQKPNIFKKNKTKINSWQVFNYFSNFADRAAIFFFQVNYIFKKVNDSCLSDRQTLYAKSERGFSLYLEIRYHILCITHTYI